MTETLELPYTTTIDGNAVKWGRIGNGPALVAIHGTPFCSQVWRKIIPHVADRRTVFYFDLVGYGQSEMRDGQDVSLAVQNSVLCTLFREWGLERPDVLAHDFGCATALRAYFLDGLRYSSLTIFDAVALAPWGSPFVQHVKSHEAAFAGMPDYMHRALLKAYLQTSAHYPLSEEALHVYSQPWTGAVGQAAFYRQIAQMDQRYTDEIEPLYQKLDCPVSMLWGENDQWIPHEKGTELAGLISDGSIEMLTACGHLVQEDRPEAIVAALLKRLS
ncbi:alpha/beta hydrolase [Neorhizobium sp. JUb45]|uniref:alpha/beta fold hydrolase n=1 Tax=unclassified Neorhizobium TaxID=2629175 RepID=UPI00104AE257|nr:alpha/beta hydrolase [Neorhizobium sp. JUb45]TCQ99977.1 pimeloyl-ACP methyl ester carboxylesterase [Neorhizobium sp. JUb45]